MEKALYELKIDPEFESLIPALAPVDLENLRESIGNSGCEEDLITWNGIIVDGHNRYHICHELNIPFSYREKNFSSREEAKEWMIDRSLGRRNMSKFSKAVLGLKYETILAEEAERRMKSGGSGDPWSNSTKGATKLKIATKVGCSEEYVYRVKKILQVADQETINRLSQEDTTVNQVFTRLFPREKKEPVPEPTTETTYIPPVDQEPVNIPPNVEVIGKKGIHVEGKMPDEEDSFPVVYSLLEDVARNYLVSLEHMLLQYTAGMVTEENNKAVLSLFRGTAQEANNIIKKRIEEVSQ